MTFTKHTANPILGLGAGGTWDAARVLEQAVIYRNNKWYMYYTGHDGGTYRIGLATSLDGITWTKEATNPVLNLGVGGTWDATHVFKLAVIYRNNKWYMYYTGRLVNEYSIGLATSLDGITWTKHANNPILVKGLGGTWDSARVYSATVLYRNNKWYMYYTGYDTINFRIGLATSLDGITWTKHANNPILVKGLGGTWDSVRVAEASVIYRNNKWYMYYTGYDTINFRIGLATSLDGITWTKHANNPVLNLGAGGTWDAAHVYNSSVLYRNNKWRMYYTGRGVVPYGIGLATSLTGV